jgi:hypothetical protein
VDNGCVSCHQNSESEPGEIAANRVETQCIASLQKNQYANAKNAKLKKLENEDSRFLFVYC